MLEQSLLIGDIGGTNARFALSRASQPGYDCAMELRCADYANVSDAIQHYLQEHQVPTPNHICLAVAGPTDGKRVTFTNNDWRIDAMQLSNECAGAHVELINDFVAIAHSIPYLETDQWLSHGPSVATDLSASTLNIGIIGPGTGLGTALLVKRNGHYSVIATEAGHINFAPTDAEQIALLERLLQRFARVTYENLISGPGLKNLHWAVSQVHGASGSDPEPDISAEAIFDLAQKDADSLASQSVQLFFKILGQYCGDIAISLNTFDGIYIAGGIIKRYPALFAESQFREGFENKADHRKLVEGIPTRLILHPNPGFLGASACVLKQSSGQSAGAIG